MNKDEPEKKGYYFTKIWFDFACQNPDKVTPSHTAMYLWFVELNNRMGWAEKFASPASQAMQYTGMKSYNTYKKIFDELVDMGFILVITQSKNQFTACIIALSKFDKAHNKALDRAKPKMPHQNLKEQLPKQVESTIQTIDSIIKEENNKPENKEINTNNNVVLFLLPEIEENKKPILFKNSIFIDIQKLKKIIGEKYDTANLEYYYEAALSWSDSKNAKRIDWPATIRNFILRDIKENKLVTNQMKPQKMSIELAVGYMNDPTI